MKIPFRNLLNNQQLEALGLSLRPRQLQPQKSWAAFQGKSGSCLSNWMGYVDQLGRACSRFSRNSNRIRNHSRLFLRHRWLSKMSCGNFVNLFGLVNNWLLELSRTFDKFIHLNRNITMKVCFHGLFLCICCIKPITQTNKHVIVILKMKT